MKYELSLLRGFVWVGLAIVVTGTIVSVIMGRQMIAYAVVGVPIIVAIVTHPKLAMIQFILLLFFQHVVNPDIPILLQDVSATMVVLAALVDLLVSRQLPVRIPHLTKYFFFLLAALVLAAAFSYDPTRAVRPIVRLLVVIAVFLSVFRLSSRFEVATLLKTYFWSCTAHSIVVVVPFVLSGGSYRSFGFSHAIFDDLAMLALPMGIALWLWADRGTGKRFALGALIIATALLATQSRVPIILSLSATLLVILQASRRRRNAFANKLHWPSISKRASTRAGVILGLLILSFIVGIALRVELFEGVLGRFERLLSTEPGGTFLLRLTLWKAALGAFWDHPLVGIGPGMFKAVHEIYPSMRMDPAFIYVRGLSAHNQVLHYLAETGIIGGFAMILIFVKQYRIARITLHDEAEKEQLASSFAIYAVAILLLASTFVEAAWLWGQSSFVAAFFLAVIVRHYYRVSTATQVTLITPSPPPGA